MQTLFTSTKPAQYPKDSSKIVTIRAIAMGCAFLCMMVRTPHQHYGFWYWMGLVSSVVAVIGYVVPMTRVLLGKTV